MSIFTIALNTGLLGMYGYQLYNVYQEKSERSNSHVALAVESNIDPDDPLLKEIEKELKPLIGNKQLILRDARHGELNPEKAIAKATITMPTSKEIVVNPDFITKIKTRVKL